MDFFCLKMWIYVQHEKTNQFYARAKYVIVYFDFPTPIDKLFICYFDGFTEALYSDKRMKISIVSFSPVNWSSWMTAAAAVWRASDSADGG